MSLPYPRTSVRGFLRAVAGLLVVALISVSSPAAAKATASGAYRLGSTRDTVVTDRTYLGKVQLVMFGFASCPDICPNALSSITRALTLLGPDRRDVRILFISVDPQRDSMPVLKTYVSAFAPETVGLTGRKAQIDAAVKAFGARYAIQGKGDDYRVSHTALVYLLDRKGKLAKLLPPGTSAKRYLAELRRLIDLR